MSSELSSSQTVFETVFEEMCRSELTRVAAIEPCDVKPIPDETAEVGDIEVVGEKLSVEAQRVLAHDLPREKNPDKPKGEKASATFELKRSGEGPGSDRRRTLACRHCRRR